MNIAVKRIARSLEASGGAIQLINSNISGEFSYPPSQHVNLPARRVQSYYRGQPICLQCGIVGSLRTLIVNRAWPNRCRLKNSLEHRHSHVSLFLERVPHINASWRATTSANFNRL
eukprot:6189025-Pleurochrysis_carterae.AAC.3